MLTKFIDSVDGWAVFLIHLAMIFLVTTISAKDFTWDTAEYGNSG